MLQVNIPISKYPLLYFEKGTISDDAHFQYPHEEIENAPCNLGILHYKFLGTDLKEYENRAMQGSGFYGEGRFYKQYVGYYKSGKKRSFLYEGSIRFTDSSVLKKISLIKPIEFE